MNNNLLTFLPTYLINNIRLSEINDLEKPFILYAHIIPKSLSNYDYDKHVAYSDNRKSCKYTETWSSGVVAKYAHGCLGKPKRIIIFNNC